MVRHWYHHVRFDFWHHDSISRLLKNGWLDIAADVVPLEHVTKILSAAKAHLIALNAYPGHWNYINRIDNTFKASLERLVELKKGAHIYIVFSFGSPTHLNWLLNLISSTLDLLVQADYRITVLWSDGSKDAASIIDRFEATSSSGKDDQVEPHLELRLEQRIGHKQRWTCAVADGEQNAIRTRALRED
ncbi:hypothetical protein BDW02DRAFT_603750 [Decorospora gaudefroyi]|uniref:Uncharacterized protein n=1 Tax=Decorospora gaudefroyi TaxID=184978 RepID=A0A6A5JXQ0_9PLEO|nr:hypothetical protein BDW02DRAFT_603750 [Decorospora gaudefroyi]